MEELSIRIVELVELLVKSLKVDAHCSTNLMSLDYFFELLFELLIIEKKFLRVIIVIQVLFKAGDFIKVQLVDFNQLFGGILVPLFYLDVHLKVNFFFLSLLSFELI